MTVEGNMLAIDTTLAACSATVRVSPRGAATAPQFAGRYEEMSTGHAERLMPMIEEVLRDAGLGYGDLDALAVTIGPGSFTGARVGIAAVRGLALATGLAVFGTTSLALIAARAAAELAGDPVMTAVSAIEVCVDARRGQIYHQTFRLGRDRHRSAVSILTSQAIAARPRNRLGDSVLVGSGAPLVAAAAAARGIKLDVAGVALLPDARFMFDQHLDRLEPPRSLYLRSPDAKPQTAGVIPRRLDETAD